MNNSEIVITQEAGGNIVEYRLDLYDNIPININKSIIDVSEIQDRMSEYTRTITIPGTSNNNDIFSNIFNISRSVVNTTAENFVPDFNPNLKANCYIYKNGISQLVGYMQLVTIRIVDDYQVEYDVVIIGRVANLFQDIADLKMNEVDLSEFDHIWNTTNISNSWSAPIGIGYYYGLIDYGLTTTNTFYVSNVFPQIYVKTIIDKIFEQAGYRYSSAFFDSDRFKRLVIPYSGKTLRLNENQVGDRTFIANRLTDSASVPIPGTRTNMPFNNTVQNTTPPTYDNGLFRVDLDYSGRYIFKADINIDIINPNPVPSVIPYVEFYISKNGVPVQTVRKLQMFTIGSSATENLTFTMQTTNLLFDVGDIVSCQIVFGNTFNADGIEYSLQAGSVFTDIPSSLVTEGTTMSLSACLPNDVNQTDFLSSIFKMFNIYAEPDPLDNKKLILEPREEFFVDTIVDLTQQVDVSRGVTIKPVGELMYKSYNYSFEPDTDSLNKFHTDRYIDPYGIYKYNVENDFVKEVYDQKVIFAPTPLLLRGAQPTILSSIVFKDSNGNRTDSASKMRILQVNEAVAFPAFWNLKSVTGATTNYPIYPYVGHLDDFNNPSFDLNFGVPREVYYTATKYTNNNLFNIYHYPFINEITNKDSKIVEYHIKISELGLSQLSFRYTYLIDKQYYRLYNINYDSNSEAPAVITFLKLSTAPAFIAETKDINGGIGDIGQGGDVAPLYNDQGARNQNTYDKYKDIFVQGSDNSLTGDALLVNSYGNTVNGNGITVLSGARNNLVNDNSVYLNASGYTSVRDGEVVINNIDQAINKTISLSVYDVSGIDTIPLEVLPVITGFWAELYDAYMTIYFEGETPVAYDLSAFKIKYSSGGVLSVFDSSLTTQVVAKKARGLTNSHPLFENEPMQLYTDDPIGASGNGKFTLELHYRLHMITV